ncbi:MAG: argininosuccinate synthase [Candidatus Omnitrophica bacterium]|nr:argininosuccinate synthase [Candidatus Omnitrophota bacterium]
MSRTVVLAYSGGLDTSVAVRWLTDRGYRVIAFMADVGAPTSSGLPRSQGVAHAVRRAKIAGAAKVVVRDLREEFARDYVIPSLQAQARYEGAYPLATALSRPLIAKHLVDVAHQQRAVAVAHGCTGKGNDQVRFEVTVRALDPRLEIVAPVREWTFRSREEEFDYAKRHGIPVDLKRKSAYSIDENLWGLSIESGPLEDPWQAPPGDSFRWINPPEQAPSRGTVATVGFERGAPVSLNGRRMNIVALIEAVCRLGSTHGIGRVDMIESRLVGIKSREVYEAPAATILLEAHAELERLVLDRELLHMKQALALKYAELVYDGLWFTPLKAALDAFVKATQQRVSGTVRLKLLKGHVQVVGRQSPFGLYRKHLATYGKDDQFDQKAAEGFIKLWGLPYEGSQGAGSREQD